MRSLLPGVVVAAYSSVATLPQLVVMNEMEWRRRQQELAANGGQPPIETPDAPPRDKRNKGADIDDIDFFQAKGSVQLTREGIRDATGVTTPIFVAEERLQKAVTESSRLPPAEAFVALRNAIGVAADAGVSERAPQMLRAAGLAQAIEQAAKTSSELGETPPDSLAEKMDALFDEDYFVPEIDPDLL